VATGRAVESIEEFEKAIKLNPRSAVFHFNLGLALAKVGFLPAALSEFEVTLNLNPGNIDVLFNIGVTLGKMGRFMDSESVLREVLRAKIDYAEAH